MTTRSAYEGFASDIKRNANQDAQQVGAIMIALAIVRAADRIAEAIESSKR